MEGSLVLAVTWLTVEELGLIPKWEVQKVGSRSEVMAEAPGLSVWMRTGAIPLSRSIRQAKIRQSTLLSAALAWIRRARIRLSTAIHLEPTRARVTVGVPDVAVQLEARVSLVWLDSDGY
jgi:hypothetical protein